ncbi:uncharacterized protein [Onthophagus taurus]|uniref:uncharacterized protein n=1 Tax=Onthophagus taurus TaxID=166361 RepID=UPI000C2071C2|nr:uncharacterized protein LOC111429000 [Onthophagus taurus]
MVFPSKEDVNSSVSSLDSDFNVNERRILDLGKQLLKHRFFIGTLHEKYRVEKINAYRDVISIDDNERHLIEQLRDYLAHIIRFYSQENWWVGITAPGKNSLPNAYCLWVDLPSGNVLGRYWFKIRSVRFQKNGELIVVVKIERKIEECLSTPSPKPLFKTIQAENENFFVTFEKGTEIIGNSFRNFFANVATPKNIKEAALFLGLLVVACVTGLFEVMKFLSEFLIKFMYAWSHFVKASLPILQIILNFMENIFKVLCTLIAHMFKPQHQQQPQLQVDPRYSAYRPVRPRYITYNRPSSRSGVTITELN